MELINVADPEKLFPEKVPEAIRSGKPFSAVHPKKLKAGRKLTDISGFCKDRIGESPDRSGRRRDSCGMIRPAIV
jgi:hypothetical protein